MGEFQCSICGSDTHDALGHDAAPVKASCLHIPNCDCRPPMPDPVDAEALAEVLARHAREAGYRDGVPTLDIRCKCGWTHPDRFVANPDIHRAHVAAELLALVREAQAAAWDEGYHAGMDHGTGGARLLNPDGSDPDYNPYRERADRIEFEAALTEVRTDYREALDRLADDERGNT